MSNHWFMVAALIVCAACVEPDPLLSADEQEAGIELVDTFDRRTSLGGWTIAGPGNDTLQSSGGNPGRYLRDPLLEAPAPYVRTTGASAFTGNFRIGQVESLGVDLIVHSWGVPPGPGRTIHLVLWNDPGTPSNNLDDVAVFGDTGVAIPLPGTGWRTAAIAMPAAVTNIPAGWSAYRAGGLVTGADASVVWNEVITSVTQTAWSYGPPLSAGLFSTIDSGVDNARITRGAGAVVP
jgi:hypothetical protein